MKCETSVIQFVQFSVILSKFVVLWQQNGFQMAFNEWKNIYINIY